MSDIPQDFVRDISERMQQMTLAEASEVFLIRMKALEQRKVDPGSFSGHPEVFFDLIMLPEEDDKEAVRQEFAAAFLVLMTNIEEYETIEDAMNALEKILTDYPFTRIKSLHLLC